MDQNPKTILETRRSLLDELSDLFPGNESLSVSRLIMEHVGFREYQVLKNPAQKVNTKIQSEIKKIVAELKKNRPIQYILGETVFLDLTFFLDEHVLIPRPETEEMVSMILLENPFNNPSIIDIGCGSGCIAVSLAKYIPSSKVSAMEIDAGAIRIARKNADHNGVAVAFSQQNLFDHAPIKGETPFDIIVSNPPYVTRSEKNLMLPRVTDHEPALALYVPDEDPMLFYREIAVFAERHLSERGMVWVEINEKYGKQTSQLFAGKGFENVRLLKDIHGKERFVCAMRTDSDVKSKLPYSDDRL
ncbi:MAG: peptide chain release factor N(5)-glutamine methyltransferase [Bacteroidales bacterium]|nr:peptide chain release factor N(5)-glutamine methyltransferase [Bacteroidales bacterium]